jgi:hypothetical protein
MLSAPRQDINTRYALIDINRYSTHYRWFRLGTKDDHYIAPWLIRDEELLLLGAKDDIKFNGPLSEWEIDSVDWEVIGEVPIKTSHHAIVLKNNIVFLCSNGEYRIIDKEHQSKTIVRRRDYLTATILAKMAN